MGNTHPGFEVSCNSYLRIHELRYTVSYIISRDARMWLSNNPDTDYFAVFRVWDSNGCCFPNFGVRRQCILNLDGK